MPALFLVVATIGLLLSLSAWVPARRSELKLACGRLGSTPRAPGSRPDAAGAPAS